MLYKILGFVIAIGISVLIGFNFGMRYKSGQIAQTTIKSLDTKIAMHNADTDAFNLASIKESTIVRIVYKEHERIRNVVKIVPCDNNKISQELVDTYNISAQP